MVFRWYMTVGGKKRRLVGIRKVVSADGCLVFIG